MISGYATIIDARYLPRGLTLQMSIARREPSALFAFYCMDDLAATLLEALSLPRCRIFTEAAFAPDALRAVRPERSVPEYCWTAKPFVLSHLLGAEPSLGWAAYLDSDMLVFGELGDALAAEESADFLLAPHRFSAEFTQYAATVGTHNAGFAAFRNSPVGRQGLDLWARLCLESCSAQVTEDTYADQKYLDNLMAQFSTGKASDHAGLNAAPWNIGRYRVREQGGQVMLDNEPLLLYHFQGLRLFNHRWADLYAGDYRLDPAVRRLIYRPYLEQLADAYRLLRMQQPGFDLGFNPIPTQIISWLRYAKRVLGGHANLIRAQLYS